MEHGLNTNHVIAFKSELRVVFGDDIYRSYFDHLDVAEAGEDDVTLKTPTHYAANVISKRYLDQVRKVYSTKIQPVRTMKIVAAPELQRTEMRAPTMQKRFKSMAAEPLQQGAQETSDLAPAQEPSRIVRGMTFERFQINDTNRLAAHAARKLLDMETPPVVMIHGPSGRGKTHLLSAVAQEWMRRNPADTVLYLTYDDLMNDVCEAIISKSLKELRTFLQNTDVLLVDDVQMLRGRKRTQEELDCLIDRLRGAGKRVMVTGTMPPKELTETGISPRLTSRLAGGLCVAVDAPDLELRMKVARQFTDEAAAQSGVRLDARHAEYAARRCDDSVRDLEGALGLLQVAAEAGAAGTHPLTDERVHRLLADQLAQKRQRPTEEAILAFICETFELSREELTGRSRKQQIVRARHAFCFAARRLTDAPLKAIGGFIGRDHTTVMHSIKTAEILAQTNPLFGQRITETYKEFGLE